MNFLAFELGGINFQNKRQKMKKKIKDTKLGTPLQVATQISIFNA